MSLWRTLRFAVHTHHLGKAARWSAARREAVVARRLGRLVRFAAARSPFYRRLYAGRNLDRVRLEDLPPVSKSVIRANFDEVVTDRAVTRAGLAAFAADTNHLGSWYLGRYAVSHTSGSQGPPLLIAQDRRTIELLFGLMSARANAGAKPGLAEGLRRLREPARVAVVGLHRGFYPSASAFEFMAAETAPFTSVRWFSAAAADLVQQLADFQPHSLVAYASVLEGLALQADRLRLEHLRQIANSSEQLTPRALRRIETAFGVPVMDHYGVGECLFLSDGCPTDGGAHVNADWAILENVDDDDRPVPAGEAGKKVLVTNLCNVVMPFIRYEVPDRIVMATEPCRCGSRLPRIARIEGRAAEAIWITDPDGRHRPLPGVLLHDAVDRLATVREWRVVQTAPDRMRLELEFLPGAGADIDAPALVARLRSSGLPVGIHVEIRAVDTLAPDEATGKFRRVVTHVAPTGSLP